MLDCRRVEPNVAGNGFTLIQIDAVLVFADLQAMAMPGIRR